MSDAETDAHRDQKDGQKTTWASESDVERLVRKDGVFVGQFNSIAKGINQNAIDKGWWKGERNEGELIALMHSELSEALEALRHGNKPDDHIPEFSGVEAELADVVIRIMDVAAAKNWRVAEALIAKINYNKTRPYKHGGKSF